MNRSPIIRSIALILLTAVIALSTAAQDTRAAPANNNFASRTVVTARQTMNGDFTVVTAQDATVEGSEPTPLCATSAIFDTVWYEFTAPHAINLVVDTFESTLNNSASNRNTVIAVYNSSSATPALNNLVQVGCSENGTNQGFFTWYPLPAGTYYLQVGAAVSLTSLSSYQVAFGSRYQLLTNTSFGIDTKQLAPWKLSGTGTVGDKVMCDGAAPRIVDICSFRFKPSATENTLLTYTLPGMANLPHDTGPTRYSEFVLQVDYYTLRAQTNATAIISVKFSDGTKIKDSRSLDGIGAIYVDPLTGKTPTKATVNIKHTGKSGKPLYITRVELFYAPGATGREASEGVLPLPAAPETR